MDKKIVECTPLLPKSLALDYRKKAPSIEIRVDSEDFRPLWENNRYGLKANGEVLLSSSDTVKVDCGFFISERVFFVEPCLRLKEAGIFSSYHIDNDGRFFVFLTNVAKKTIEIKDKEIFAYLTLLEISYVGEV
jgi:hypothetical protein